MNSNYGKKFDFDLGMGSSSRNKSINDQKNKTSSNKPSWTHQPAAPTQPTSMAGDIFGKTWSSSIPSSSIGIVDKDPNLFGDLVNSALGQPKSGNSNVPLKNSTTASNIKPSFSMGNFTDSLPKSSTNFGINWGGSSANFTSNVLGAPTIKSNNGIGGGGSKSKDPFGSLLDFGSKPLNNTTTTTKTNSSNDGFGDFGFSNSNSIPSFNMDNFGSKPVKTTADDFGNFLNPPKASVSSFTTSNPTPSFNTNDLGKPTNTKAFPGSGNPSPGINMDIFDKPLARFPAQSSSATVDPLDMLFTPSKNGIEGSNMDDWGAEADSSGPTTELNGLPPPPAGVNASAAKSKGMDTYKQGQYADAIKWLSWAVILLEKSGDNGGTVVTEILSSRASCYKEVGEYKKAVADCTKVLENDDTNVTVLVQRALLYESLEKYRLGAEDLRTALKIDPSNRIARSTVHRLSKLAD